MGKHLGFLILLAAACQGFLGASEPGAVSLDPETALNQLKEGHRRFLQGTLIHPHSGQERREEVAKGQHPFVTILSCSDSRVPPEILFDAGLGDLFIVRVAGNVADTDEIATVEYGTAHLGTSLVVVLGHSFCGAVTAVVSGGTAEGNLPGLLDNAIPPVQRAKQALGAGATQALVVERAVEENIQQSMEDLLVRSPVVSELVKEGKVKVVGAVYHLETGEVDWMGPHPRQAQLLESARSAGEGDLWGTLFFIYLLPSIGTLLLLFLVLKLFVEPRRVFSTLKIRGRLFFSFLFLGLVIGGWGVFLATLPEAEGALWGLAPVVLLCALFSLRFAQVHEGVIKDFLKQMVRRRREETTGD